MRTWVARTLLHRNTWNITSTRTKRPAFVTDIAYSPRLEQVESKAVHRCSCLR